MKKLALHWQILLALILAVTYGLIFNTDYKLTSESFTALSQKEVDSSVVHKIKPLQNKTFTSAEALAKHLNQYLTKKEIREYQSVIIEEAYYNPAIKAISWLGVVFLRALKMLVIPLIFISIVGGIGSLEKEHKMGRLGLKTIVYYITTSTLAIILSLILLYVLKPGVYSEVTLPLTHQEIAKSQSLGELFINIVPENIFKAFVENKMLSVIFVSILIGVFIPKVSHKYQSKLITGVNALYSLIMKITLFVVKLAPIGVFGLVAKVIADQNNFGNLVYGLGYFMLTVIAALMIHSFVILPLILRFVGKVHPYRHLKNMWATLLTAFSTSSSAATLPLTLDVVENRSGVSKKISNFTLPIGATVNMDGTAIYICAVVLFLAQLKGIQLPFTEQLVILLTTILASIGTAGIPMGSLVIITVIMNTLGIPLEWIAVILPADRILDMLRTASNVWSDSCGAVLIAKTEGETLNIE